MQEEQATLPEPADSLTAQAADSSRARRHPGLLRHAGGIDTPELDARLLLCHAAALTHEAYIASAREALQPAARARLDAAIARRLKHEPVARITGTASSTAGASASIRKCSTRAPTPRP